MPTRPGSLRSVRAQASQEFPQVRQEDAVSLVCLQGPGQKDRPGRAVPTRLAPMRSGTARS